MKRDVRKKWGFVCCGALFRGVKNTVCGDIDDHIMGHRGDQINYFNCPNAMMGVGKVYIPRIIEL